MGKLIVCTGQTAKHPFLFSDTQIPIYTIEELCYYIYHNIESIGDELSSKKLTAFLREELKLTQRADYIDSLIDKKAGMKDLIVSILCSADYYDKAEISHLLTEIDQLYSLHPVQRKKRQADLCMRHKQWREALSRYQAIINGREFTQLSSKEYGDILHNMGVLYANCGAFLTAAEKFKEAYEQNGSNQSLKQYLYALKLSNQDALFDREIKIHVGSRELLAQLEQDLFRVAQDSDYAVLETQVTRLKELRQQGHANEYYDRLSELLAVMKKEYRNHSL